MSDYIKEKVEEFRERYLKTPEGWILDGKNGAEIEKWFAKSLQEMEERAKRETIEDFKRKLNVFSPSEEKEESGEKECECICHYTLQVLTTPKGATLRKECSHCSPKKEKRGR